MTLVREFATSQSEPAFATLVECHIGLVHSAAFRQTGDPHLAEEITQAAFIVLGVFAGSILWWFTLTTVVGLFHPRLDARVMKIINHVSGVAVLLFGVLVLAHVAWRHLHLWLHHLT